MTGELTSGRGAGTNLWISFGSTIFTNGADKSALTGTTAGWAFGTGVGLISPPLFSPVLGAGSALLDVLFSLRSGGY